jgi:hypothetical protein
MEPSWRIKLAKAFGLAVPAAIALMIVRKSLLFSLAMASW